MKSYPRIFQKVFREPWMVMPTQLRSIQDTLIAHVKGMNVRGFEDGDYEEDKPASVIDYAGNGVHLIYVQGVIGKGLSGLEMMCGGCDLNRINDAIKALLARPGGETVAFVFDSPGGTVTGLWETAALIRKLCEKYYVVSYCEDMCASAAYYLASQTDWIFCTRSCRIGSIGTVLAWVDYSEQMKMNGEKAVIFQGGALKTAGYSGKEMSEAEWKLFNDWVQKDYVEFKGTVNGKRPQIADETMQGQCFSGEEALAAGLADQLVLDWDEVVSELV